MIERLKHTARTVREVPGRIVHNALNERLPMTLAAAAVTAGVLSDSLNPVAESLGFVSIAAMLALIGKSLTDRKRREEIKYHEGFGHGYAKGLQAGIIFNAEPGLVRRLPLHLPPEGEPLYASLDGSRTIDDPMKLIHAIGDPFDAAVRVGFRLQQIANGRESTPDQMEYLRLVQAGFRMVPDARRMMYDEGQGLLDKMDTAISVYELTNNPDQNPPAL